ncbi:MAG: hypothetical protein AAGH67_17755 [Cyanobacteria bacterium P01_H01_bin.162]
MNSSVDHSVNDALVQLEGESNAITKAEAEQPLSFPYQAEIWSGRFAMLGLTTVAMAIALT